MIGLHPYPSELRLSLPEDEKEVTFVLTRDRDGVWLQQVGEKVQYRITRDAGAEPTINFWHVDGTERHL